MLNKNGNKVVIKGDVNVGEEGVFSGRDTNITEIYHVDSKTVLMEDIPLNVSGYINRTEERRNLIKAIIDTDVVQIYGISGIGKTELVQDITRELKTKYEKSYFISSYENEDVNLSEVISFSGSKLNLLDQVKLYKTLIVIDNYNCTIDKLVQEFREANRI
jgi:Cdc6-like AAA superfamily ATPase